MMDPPGAPLMDSAYYIPVLLEAQDLAGEMARLVEYGACQLLPILQKIFKPTSTPWSHWHETFMAPRQPDTKYTIIIYIYMLVYGAKSISKN
jgi:hypothetical protein